MNEKSKGQEQVDDWYQEAYDGVYHGSLTASIYAWVFRFMEKPHRWRGPSRIIEIGAGKGHYRRAAKPNFTEYVELDLRMDSAAETPGVTRIEGNGEATGLESNSFDRLVATCVLVHLDNPRTALNDWKRIVRPGGDLTIYVPPEAGLLVRLLRRWFFWPKARRRGYDGRLIASLEHRYSFFYLDALIKDVFDDAQVFRRTVPFRRAEFDLALFHVYDILLPEGA